MRSPIKPNGDRAWLARGVLTTALLFVVGATATTAPELRQEKRMTRFDDLLSEQARTRDEAVDAILRERKSVIEQLIPLIDPANAKKYSDETRSAAAYVLGDVRAVEAVPVLSQALVHPPGPKLGYDGTRYDAPLFTALVKIGRPAAPAMIENVETSDHQALRKNSLDVLYHVLGGKRRLLELLLKLKERSTDTETLRRIKDAQSWAEAHYKEDKEPLY